jgi:hypothetical protein
MERHTWLIARSRNRSRRSLAFLSWLASRVLVAETSSRDSIAIISPTLKPAAANGLPAIGVHRSRAHQSHLL